MLIVCELLTIHPFDKSSTYRVIFTVESTGKMGVFRIPFNPLF